MTRSPARLRGARIPPADSKPRPEPRYHDHPAGRAIHCPEAFFPGAVTRRRSGQAGDPAGVPFRQLIRIPSGVPADTGNPCPAPFRRHRPIRTFRRTPRLIQHQACKTIWGGVRVIIRCHLMAVHNVPCFLLHVSLSLSFRPPARCAAPGPGPARSVRRGPARLARANVARARPGAGGGTAPRPPRRRGRPPAGRYRADGARRTVTAPAANCACGMRGHCALFLRNPEARPRKGAQFPPRNSRNSSRSGGRKWLMGGECRDSVVVYPEIGENEKGELAAREWSAGAPFPPARTSLSCATWRPR